MWFKLITLAAFIAHWCSCVWFWMSKDYKVDDTLLEALNSCADRSLLTRAVVDVWETSRTTVETGLAANSTAIAKHVQRLLNDDNTVHSWRFDNKTHDEKDIYEHYVLSAFSKYVCSMYWAFQTVSTVGYGDLAPHSNVERWYANFIFVVGVSSLSVMTAFLAKMLVGMTVNSKSAYRTQVTAIVEYMENRGMNSDVVERVLQYYEQRWLSSRGKEEDFFHDLPEHLRADIYAELNSRLVLGVPFFREYRDSKVRCWIRLLVSLVASSLSSLLFSVTSLLTCLLTCLLASSLISRRSSPR